MTITIKAGLCKVAGDLLGLLLVAMAASIVHL